MDHPSHLEVLQELDRSALHRQLLGDLYMLVSIRAAMPSDALGMVALGPVRAEMIDGEIRMLLDALWPTG